MTAPHLLDRAGLAPEAQRLVHDLENEYGTRFSHLVHFSAAELSALHAPGPLPPNVRVASAADPRMTDRMETVTEVANLPHQRPADRDRYFQALIDMYEMLPYGSGTSHGSRTPRSSRPNARAASSPRHSACVRTTTTTGPLRPNAYTWTRDCSSVWTADFRSRPGEWSSSTASWPAVSR